MFEKQNIIDAVAILKQKFGERLSEAQSVRQHHAQSTTRMEQQLPDAVIFAETTQEVSDILNICNQYRCPIVAFGVGSSLEGHVNASHGGISIDLNAMNKILKVNSEDLDTVIQPGVTRVQLNEHLRDSGLFFPIDPGANASLGGMAATRASGTNAVRYGTMKDNILALEAVMPDGRIIRTGTRARKSSAGYDITRLLIGSEGTLGIITELTVKLHGIPEKIAGGVCSFPSIKAACDTVISVIQFGIPMARIELLDALQVKACNGYSGLSLPEEPLLLVEFHGSETSVAEQAEMFGEIASEHTNSAFSWTTNTEERSMLWKARHDAYWASMSLMPGAVSVSTDVCVPISRLAECVELTRLDMKEHGIISPMVGHVGDGNFHCLPLTMPEDDEMQQKITDFSKRLSKRAIDMGGTCTGEHGIGMGKQTYLVDELGETVDFMKQIKTAFDPNNIMNPGKIFQT